MSEYKLCPKCDSLSFYNSYFGKMMCNTCEHTWKDERETISFPILNNLTPTVESCTMKVLEEVGELMQLIGKGQGLSGESEMLEACMWANSAVKEALDTAQAAVTMAYTIAKEYGIRMEIMMHEHEMKLRERGYLK